MQGILFGTLFVVINLARAQVWNDQSNGVTIKTLFVPLRKGSTSINIPDFSKVQPLATLNLPSLSLGENLQQASTLSQNFRSKGNIFELNAHSLQDVRAKHGLPPFKSELTSQISNFPNLYQNSNFPQQQYNNGPYQPVENAPNHHAPSQYQFNQPESSYGSGQHQNAIYQRNNTDFQHQSNDMSNENFGNQDSRQNFAAGRMPNYYNAMNTGQQVYVRENLNLKIPTSDLAYTPSHNTRHQVEVYDRENSANQEIVRPQNVESSFPGQPSRYYHQMTPDTATKQQPYMSPPNESPSYVASHHQMSYGIQNIPDSQHLDSVTRNPNTYQGVQGQENRHNPVNQQLQQPVNTYAVVHQRIPANSFSGEGNRGNIQSDQGHIEHYKQVSEVRPVTETRHSSHSAYVNNEPAEYIKLSPNQDQIPMQVASQNYLKAENPRNSVENMQYPMKQFAPGNVNSYHYNSPPPVTQMQIMVPRGQHSSSEGQYFHQQLGSPSDTEIRNQDMKSNQPHHSGSQGPYPDPASETFYPENKQIYLAPPSDYGSQQERFHQQQPMNEQGYMRYPPPNEANVHNSRIPLSIQAGQVGIHVSLPNKSYVNRDSSNYNNAYA